MMIRNINEEKESNIIYNGVKYRKKESLLNNGLKNIGFSSIEALMEGTDDSIDAGAKNIEIKIFEEDYTSKFKESIIAERYSYIIFDDGNGTIDVNKIFDFGEEKEEIYTSKKEYYTKNGKFHYGTISHINVGEEVSFFSKVKENSKWKVCSLIYNKKNNCGYISEEREISEEEGHLLKLHEINLSIESGSILLVRGVKKTSFGYNDINRCCEHVINELGVTYYEYLKGNVKSKKRNIVTILRYKGKNIVKKFNDSYMEIMRQINKDEILNIKINNQEIKPLNPLCTDLTDSRVKPVVFGRYKITLREIMEWYKDEIDEYDKKNEFSHIFTEDELKDMAIEIKLVAIGKSKILELYGKSKNLSEIYYPKYNYKGFYNKRNNRYIGKAMGMLGIVVDHPSHTRFRGEISFSPVFDELFLIQINKNRNSISILLRELIEIKIAEDQNLKGDGASAKIRNFLETGEFVNEDVSYNDFETRIIKLERKANELKEKLRKYSQNTDIISEIIERVRSISTEEEINKLEERFAAEKSKYEENNKILFSNFNNLIARIKRYNSSSKLKGSDVEWMNGLKSPDVEGEIYGIFLVIYLLYKEYFDFELKGYTTSIGVDLVASVSSDLFEEYKFKERYGTLIDIKNGNIQYKNNGYNIDDNIDEMYTFIELKNNLISEMNHSLKLVSHIICWKKNNRITEIKAIDGIYTFTDRNKEVLIGANGEKVKVIYLKNVIEQISGGKFKN